MILVFLIISIALVIGGFVFMAKIDDDAGFGIALIGAITFLVALIITIFLTVSVSNLSTCDERIEMYQEENTKIEQQIANVVAQYQQYETEIFTEVAPESSISLVALYPELKADTLVQKQIEIYTANNEKIKALKEEKISGKVCKWWLYFGGGDS